MKKITEEVKKETTLEELKEQLKECEKQRDEYLAGWQRSRADFLNYKKDETERAQSNRRAYQREWLLRILELYDDLERAEQHLPENLKEDEWVKAVLQMQKQFLGGIEGLEEIKAEGERFDPRFHEAIGEVKGEGEPGTVADVLQKGYMLNGELLRPAKVKVIK